MNVRSKEFKGFWSDALHLLQIVYRAKRPVGVAKRKNAFGGLRSDSGQFFEFRCACPVYVDVQRSRSGWRPGRLAGRGGRRCGRLMPAGIRFAGGGEGRRRSRIRRCAALHPRPLEKDPVQFVVRVRRHQYGLLLDLTYNNADNEQSGQARERHGLVSRQA